MSKYRILKMRGKDCKDSYYRGYHYTEDVYVTQKLKTFLILFKYWKTIDTSLHLSLAEWVVEWDKEKQAAKNDKKSSVKVVKKYE